MKKSQITVFIVLGIVVMIIFGLFYFVNSQGSEGALKKKVNKAFSDFLSSSQFTKVTTNCLELTTQEGLFLVGMQGGRIYSFQAKEGFQISPSYFYHTYNYTEENPNGTLYNVSYGIRAQNPINMISPDPPDYPYPGSLVVDPINHFNPYHDSVCSQANYSGVFLLHNKSNPRLWPLIPALCNSKGQNPSSRNSCEHYAYPGQKSIQDYLESYIAEKIKACINFSYYNTSTYSIVYGNATPAITMGDNDLTATLNLSLIVSLKGKPPRTEWLSFATTPKIRFKQSDELAHHLIGQCPSNSPYLIADGYNIFFNITRDDPGDCLSGRQPCKTMGFDAYKIKDYCSMNNCSKTRHLNYSDLLIIEDSLSMVHDRPYRFQFFVENRRPALDFIDENITANTTYFRYLNTTFYLNATQIYGNGYPLSDAYNIQMKAGNTVRVYPFGADPDEDELTYSYYQMSGGPVTTSCALVAAAQPNFDVQCLLAGYTQIVLNVSDNEGLYDYQVLKINVMP